MHTKRKGDYLFKLGFQATDDGESIPCMKNCDLWKKRSWGKGGDEDDDDDDDDEDHTDESDDSWGR